MSDLLCCRLCLNVSTINKSNINLFGNESNDMLRHRIAECICITICAEDSLPTSICGECHEKFTDFYNFRSRCQYSDYTLRQQLLCNENLKSEDIGCIYNTEIKDEMKEDSIEDNTCLDVVRISPSRRENGQINKKRVKGQTTRKRRKKEKREKEVLQEQKELMRHDWETDGPDLIVPSVNESDDTAGAERVPNIQSSNNVIRPIGRQKKYVKPRHICEICGKYVQNIREHSMTHADERPKKFQCTECGVSYVYHQTFAAHKRTHLAEKPFSCAYCGRGFYKKDLLQKHMLVHSGERKYPCDICGKAFQTQYNLKTHTRVHTRERPFKCDYCQDTFVHRAVLNPHVKKCRLKYEQYLEGASEHEQII